MPIKVDYPSSLGSIARSRATSRHWKRQGNEEPIEYLDVVRNRVFLRDADSLNSMAHQMTQQSFCRVSELAQEKYSYEAGWGFAM
jgi:hypothetical protein